MRLMTGCRHGIIDAYREQCLACVHGPIQDGFWVAVCQLPYMTRGEVHVVHVHGGCAYGFHGEHPTDAYKAATLRFLRRLDVPEWEDPDTVLANPEGGEHHG